MERKYFLNKVCNEIKYIPVREGISEELEQHIEEVMEGYIVKGVDEKRAEEIAVEQMGSATKIGKELNKIHKPKLDWKLLILIMILMGFGIGICLLKQSDESANYLRDTMIYGILGIGIGISIYFFDYRKMKKYSNVIYGIASIIVLLSIFTGGTINGAKIFDSSFMPGYLVVPLYLIAFVGFITNTKKNSKKIMILCLLSLWLIMQIPSLTSAISLGFVYLIITTLKITKTQENKMKKLVILYGTIGIVAMIIIINMGLLKSYRIERIVTSFKPELDPQGSGYIGMLQKEILENAQLVGEAETDIISNDKIIINQDGRFTFIYLLGKAGLLTALLLVLTIVLIAIKLIYNAKNITDMYGKCMIIGLTTLYILQSVSSVLMNINLGIHTYVNLPFVTYEGGYLITNIINMAIILAIYRRKDINGYDKENLKKGVIATLLPGLDKAIKKIHL